MNGSGSRAGLSASLRIRRQPWIKPGDLPSRLLFIRIPATALHTGDDLDPVQRTLLTQCAWTLHKGFVTADGGPDALSWPGIFGAGSGNAGYFFRIG